MIPRLALVLFVTLPVLPGAEKDPEVKFLAERLPSKLGEVVMVNEGGKFSERFVIPKNNLSRFLKAPAREFRIRQVEKEASDLVTVRLPEKGDSFICLLLPHSEGKFSPVVIPVDDSFKGGDVYFYNLSPKPVLGKMGTVQLGLKPSEGKIIRPKGAHEEGFYDVAFAIRETSGNRMLSCTRWRVSETRRRYAFFFVNPDNGRITYRVVNEFAPSRSVAGES